MKSGHILGRTGLLGGIVLLFIYVDSHFWRGKTAFGGVKKCENSCEKYGEHSVFRIEIRGEKVALAIEKNGNNTWEMVEPFAWPVNPFAVRKFFQILGQNPRMSPKYTLKLSKKNQTKTFGGTIRGLNSLAEECSGTEEDLDEIIALGPQFWCQRSICPLKSNEIATFSLTFPGKNREFLLAKKNATWYFERPIEIEADASAVQKILEWIANFDVSPQTKAEAMENLSKNGEKNKKKCIDISENFFKKPHVTIALVDERKRRFSVSCSEYFREDKGAKIVRYAWLEGHGALFEVPWNGEWDRPLQALCAQSLFPEVQSVTFSLAQKKLFLSRNESGEWNVLKFSDESPLFQALEHFDTPALLLLFSLLQPLDAVSKTEMADAVSAEKLFLEVNGALKFEAFFSGNAAYLLPAHKNYAIRIDEDILQKFLKIMRNV
ncbi:MAG: hypothetical protein LBJ81_02745 [Puniceicoccales bacterium]|nr:hypothetical protein [Puniceicoccales bacterium]